ncbi:MAG: hypothetical protein CME62_05725 [Halobacteriovoraceae bacterium]|nr:hypothetical protein [Halobacteriovoraceae bacterium]|tara:strand:- start:6092 stop:6895 length:804 start_codon:yes stop_codon:yes gene_type:complete
MKKLFFLTPFLLIISCSLGSLFIGKLDWLITYKTADRLGLYVKQEDLLREDVKKLLDEIKPEAKILKSQLRIILRHTDNVDGLPKKEIITTLGQAYKTGNQKVFATLAKYLAELTEKQQKPFLATIEKQIKKNKKKINKKKQHEKFIDKCEEFLGELSPTQKLMIKKQQPHLLQISTFLLQHKEYQYKEIKEIYKRDPSQRQQLFIKLFTDTTHLKKLQNSESYKNVSNAVFGVLKKMTKKQKEHLQDKLNFIDDLLESFIEHKYND